MSFWADLNDLPEILRLTVDVPTTAEVRLWQDNGGTLYIESDDYPLVVGGLEAVSGSPFRSDAENWPCWLENSAGVHYVSRGDFDAITDEPEVRLVATYHQGVITQTETCGRNASDYLGDDYQEP